MKNRRLAMLSLLISALTGAVQAQTQPIAAASNRVGSWTVDRSPRCGAVSVCKTARFRSPNLPI